MREDPWDNARFAYGPMSVPPPSAWDKDKDWTPQSTADTLNIYPPDGTSATYQICPRCGMEIRTDSLWFDGRPWHPVCYNLLYTNHQSIINQTLLQVLEEARNYVTIDLQYIPVRKAIEAYDKLCYNEEPCSK